MGARTRHVAPGIRRLPGENGGLVVESAGRPAAFDAGDPAPRAPRTAGLPGVCATRPDGERPQRVGRHGLMNRAGYLRDRQRRANERAAAVARQRGDAALAARIAARERAAAEGFAHRLAEQTTAA